MTGTVLLTGGTGKTSSRIADKLQKLNIPVLLTSRKGQAGAPAGQKAVKFDWYDEATHLNPFNEDKNIDTVYLIIVPRPDSDAVAIVKKFIELAREKGVKRFLLMSASVMEKGGPAPQGQIHAHLESIGVDYGVLRPSWFFGNFLTTSTIKTDDEFITATGTAKIGFISEDDIADVAVELLSSSKLGGADRIIVGPELLSYDQIAEQLSQVLGRKITHRSVSADERKKAYIQVGVTEQVAGMLAFVEANVVAAGSEERTYSISDKSIGKIRFVDFAEANKAVWQK